MLLKTKREMFTDYVLVFEPLSIIPPESILMETAFTLRALDAMKMQRFQY